MSLMDAAASGIIANLAKPPDVTAGGDGIAGFFSGYSAGYKQQQRRMQAAVGDLDPNDKAPVPSLFGAVVNGFLKAPAERKANADPMFDINKTVAEQTVKMNALHIDEAVKRRDDAVQLKADAANFGRFVQQGLKDGAVTSDEFRGQFLDHLARSPLMLKDPGVQELVKQVQMSQTFLQHKQDVEKARANADAAGLKPTSQSVRTETGVETFAAPFDPKAAGLEVSGYNAKTGAPTYARPRVGDSESEKEAPVLETLTGKDGKTYTVLFNKNTGKSEIVDAAAGTRYGPKSGITGATQTKAEASISAGENIVSRARELSKLLRPENVGPRGFFNRAADQFLPNVIPDWKVGDSVEAATVAGELQSSVIHLLKSDSNIAEGERKKLMQAIPDPTRFLSSAAPTEKLKLAQLLLDAGQLSRRAAVTKKAPISKTWLKQDEIQAMWQRKEITDEEATQMLQNSGWALIAELRAQVANGQ